MSALSFKINAETDKLNSFIASLERLKKVLADIPSGTKEFDEISKRIAEVETQISKAMGNIAKLQQRMDDAASSAVSTATMSASKEAAEAINAESVAYHELLEELKAVSASKRENASLMQEYTALSKNAADIIHSLNKAERDGFALTEAQLNARAKATIEYEQYKQAISKARRELANQIKFEDAARGSIDEMAQALARMRTVYRQLNETDRQSEFGQKLLANIQTLDQKVKELDFSMGNHQRNIGNYGSQFNALSFSIQQTARELPSIAYGPQVFFSAISNNLPILADAIASTRKEIDLAKKSGEKFVPLSKQLLSSIVSWQTLLVAGVTVLTMYGDDIVKWAKQLIEGKKAFNATAQAAEEFHNTMIEGAADAQREVAKLKVLYNATQDVSKSYDDRRKAAEELQEMYPAYFGNMSEEKILSGQLKTQYDDLREALVKVAQARAAMSKITDLESVRIAAEMSEEYNSIRDKEAANYAKINKLEADLIEKIKLRDKVASKGGLTTGYNAEIKSTELQIKALKDITKDEFEDWLKENEDNYKWIKDKGIQTFTELFEYINRANEQLTPIAEGAFASGTPDDLDEQKKEAERAAKEQASIAERSREFVKGILEDMAIESREMAIRSMKDGTDKVIAQIDLDYDKREQQITKREEELRNLQNGELTKSQTEMFERWRNMNERNRLNSLESLKPQIQTIDVGELFAQEEAARREYLKAYGDFEEKRLAITEEYQEKIANAATSWDEEMLRAELKAALDALDQTMIEKTDLWVRLFDDASKMTRAQLKAVISETEGLLDYLSGATDKKPIGFTDEALAALKENSDIIKDIYDGLIDKQKEYDEQTSYPFSNLIKGLQSLKKARESERAAQEAATEDEKKEKTEAALNKKGEALAYIKNEASFAAEALSNISQKLQELANSTSDEALKERAEKLSSAAQVLSSAAQGFAQGGWIGGLVGAATNVVNQLFDSFISAKREREEQQQNALDFARSYELLMLSLKDEDYESIFGVRAIQKATKAYENAELALQSYKDEVSEQLTWSNIWDMGSGSLEDLLEDMNKGYSKLQAMQIKTRDRSGFANFFGAKDKYTSLYDLAPELWGEDGAFNIDAAKAFLETNTQISDSQRKEIENVIELKEQYDSLMEEIDKTLGDIFGPLASDLTDIIFDAVRDGADAWDEFNKRGSEVINKLGKQMVQEMFVQAYLDKYEESLKNAFAGDNVEDITEAIAQITKTMFSGMGAMLEGATAAAMAWDEAAKDAGWDVESSAEAQSATARGFQAMSQETGSELNGRFADMQGKMGEIRDLTLEQTQGILDIIASMSLIGGSLEHQVNVSDELLRYAVMSYMEILGIKGDTGAMRLLLSTIQEDMASVKKNTSGLIS